MPKTAYLHFFKLNKKLSLFCHYFAIFHLSTPIIAQFKALNLPFHCIPHFCYPQFFSPIATPIWFFSTTPLLVPPSKSQFFYSYLNQFFTLNSQITFIQSQRPFCPFPIPQIYPFSSLCKISMLKTVYLHFFKFESKALPFLPLLRHFFCYPQFFSPISRHQFDFFQPHCQTPRVYWNGGVCHTPEDKVFQISVIEVSFLVGFLAYFDSLILCADLVEVPTANFEAVFKSSNGAYLNLATLLSPQNTVFKSSFSSLKPLYGIPYHLETRQRGLNNVCQPYMAS